MRHAGRSPESCSERSTWPDTHLTATSRTTATWKATWTWPRLSREAVIAATVVHRRHIAGDPRQIGGAAPTRSMRRRAHRRIDAAAAKERSAARKMGERRVRPGAVVRAKSDQRVRQGDGTAIPKTSTIAHASVHESASVHTKASLQTAALRKIDRSSGWGRTGRPRHVQQEGRPLARAPLNRPAEQRRWQWRPRWRR